MELKDALLTLTLVLASGAATVVSESIDTGKSTDLAQQPGSIEGILTVPTLTASQLPDAVTMKYDIIFSDKADLSDPVVYIAGAITQVGAAGAGAVANTYRFRLPTNGKRYLGFRATNGGTGNASAVSAILELAA